MCTCEGYFCATFRAFTRWLRTGMWLEERETDRTHHDTNRRRNMSKKILLLGFSDSVLTNAQQQLTRPDLEVFRGKSVEDVRSRLSQTTDRKSTRLNSSH